jgi:GDP-4-dehydro-6-deoxy-D-mannose reductase
LKYFITGASGFVAGHLIEAIFENNPQEQVFALDLTEPAYDFLDTERRRSVRYIKADLLDLDNVVGALGASRPHYVIHLAASSSVAHSWQHPAESFKNNLNIFLNLLEAVRQVNSGIRILSVGSSEQYGIVSSERLPLKEVDPPNPISPYAVARVAQENLASVYVKGYKMDIVSTRSFNHFGPRQDSRFVLPGFARQITEIKKGRRRPTIQVGDLNIVRDFTDVRDIVKAYLLLLNKGMAGEIYNVCSGTGRTLEDCLKRLVGIADVECEIQKAGELLRPVDNPVIIGDNTKIKELTGWSPGIPFEVTLRDTYEYWMSKI